MKSLLKDILRISKITNIGYCCVMVMFLLTAVLGHGSYWYLLEPPIAYALMLWIIRKYIWNKKPLFTKRNNDYP